MILWELVAIKLFFSFFNSLWFSLDDEEVLEQEQTQTVEFKKSSVKTPKQSFPKNKKQRSISSKKKPIETSNRTFETSQLNVSTFLISV